MTRILGLGAVAVVLAACGWQTRAADDKPKSDAKERFDLVVREDSSPGSTATRRPWNGA